MAKMNDDTLRAVLDHEIQQSTSWAVSTIREEQERNLQYYLGLPMGNEVDGRSQVISWDVFEIVESALPSFLEPFFGGDNIGEFQPQGPEDEAYADQATDYVNHVIREQNDGFLIFYTWIKDALISKAGIVRADWEECDPKREEYSGLTDEQLVMLQQNPRIQIVEHSAQPMPIPGIEGLNPAQMMQQFPTGVPMLHDVTVMVQKPGRVKIENIRPENFIVSRGAQTLERANLKGEIVTYTRSEIALMGFKREAYKVNSYDGAESFVETVEDIREDGLSLMEEGDSVDKALEEVRLFRGFIRTDYNGDGVAEYRRVLVGGNMILENEECEYHNYALITPIPVPHRVIGMGYADPAAEIQRLKTGLTRQYLDSLYLANNPRTYVNMDAQVKIDDLLSQRIGGIVRGKGPANMAVAPLQTSLVARESLEGIQFADTMRETRLGVTKYNQGLDSEALNKTATGVQKIMNAADKRLLLTLRIMAETGVRSLFKLVLKLVTKYQDVAATVRLRNQWVQFDPSSWNAEMDVTIAIGDTDKDQQLAALMQFGQFMQIAAQVGVVSPKNVYEYGKLLAKNAKIRGAEERLLTQPPDQPPEPGPDPEVLKEQAKAQAMLQAEQMKAQVTVQVEQQKAQLEQQKLQGQLEVQAANDQRDAERARMQAEMDAQLEAQKSELQAALERERLAFDRWKVEQEIAFKVWQTQFQAGVQAEQFAMQKQVDLTVAENKANERPAGA